MVYLIILMAFLGGIILNFMPCVFPILSIKAILVQGSLNVKRARVEALLYMLGVVVSFLLMATILILLRSKGEGFGWGFQLQSPWFVSIMIVVFLLITLMLLDVIHFHNPFANAVGKIFIIDKAAQRALPFWLLVLVLLLLWVLR